MYTQIYLLFSLCLLLLLMLLCVSVCLCVTCLGVFNKTNKWMNNTNINNNADNPAQKKTQIHANITFRHWISRQQKKYGLFPPVSLHNVTFIFWVFGFLFIIYHVGSTISSSFVFSEPWRNTIKMWKKLLNIFRDKDRLVIYVFFMVMKMMVMGQ